MSGWTQSAPFSGWHLVPLLQLWDETALADSYPEVLPVWEKEFSLWTKTVCLDGLRSSTLSSPSGSCWLSCSCSLPQVLALLLLPLCFLQPLQCCHPSQAGKATGAPWADGVGVLTVPSTVFGDTQGGWSRTPGGSGLPQKHSVILLPCPDSGGRHKSFAEGDKQGGLCVVAQWGVTPLKTQESSCLLTTNSNFPWEVRILQKACQLAALIIQLLA